MRRKERRISSNQDEVILQLGSKECRVGFLKAPEDLGQSPTIFATMHLKKRPFSWRRHHETRQLYQAAFNEMKSRARRENRPVDHVYTTSHPKMIEFTQSHGARIFGWTPKELQPNQAGVLAITTIIENK